PAIEADQRTARTDDRPQRVAENTFPPSGSVLPDATGPSSGNSGSTSANGDNATKPAALRERFGQKYDNLRPEDFSIKAIEFGYWLEAHGRELSPADKQQALAEYAFLQNSISSRLNQEYKSPRESGYLLSAGRQLFQGATNSGLVSVNDLPLSMLVLGGTVALLETPPPWYEAIGRRGRDRSPQTTPHRRTRQRRRGRGRRSAQSQRRPATERRRSGCGEVARDGCRRQRHQWGRA